MQPILERLFMRQWLVNTFGRRLSSWLLGLSAILILGAAGNLATGRRWLATVSPAQTIRADETSRERENYLTMVGVQRWHQQGYRGQGCKVAILDSGFRGYRAFLGRELPQRILTKSFRKDENFEARDSQHGILCAEVIHSLAPAAELILVNWEPDDPQSFLQAARWAKAHGAQIFSCSLIMPNWSDGEGGGDIHAQLRQILGSGTERDDLLFFASAGNTALRHWTGAFDPDPHGLHQWGPGRTVNLLKPWGNERVAVELYGPTRTPCRLQVLEEGTGALIAQASLETDGKLPCGQAVLRFDPQPGRKYLIRLQCQPGTRYDSSDRFHLVALGANLEDYTPGGSIPFPGDGTNVVAVGAVDQGGKRLDYSSCGPNSTKPKPDFVGLIPFPCSSRERPFAGTSAAAPQGAALAALCWSRHPEWTAAEIRAALQTSALDLNIPGHDSETGYGLMRLP
jgi:hypothetical protein